MDDAVVTAAGLAACKLQNRPIAIQSARTGSLSRPRLSGHEREQTRNVKTTPARIAHAERETWRGRLSRSRPARSGNRCRAGGGLLHRNKTPSTSIRLLPMISIPRKILKATSRWLASPRILGIAVAFLKRGTHTAQLTLSGVVPLMDYWILHAPCGRNQTTQT